MKPLYSIQRHINVFIADIDSGNFPIRKKTCPTFVIHRQPYTKMTLWLIVFWQLCTARAGATSIVILNNANQIVVSADAMEVHNGPAMSICKIFKIGTVYWAVSGVMFDSEAKYSIAEIVKKSYIPGSTVEQLLNAFEKNAVNPLKSTLEYDLLMSPRNFQTVRYHPLEIAFWAFERGKPVVAHVFYTTKLNGRKIDLVKYDETIVDCRREDCSIHAHATLLGAKDSILKWASSHPSWGYGIVTASPNMVKLSVAESPRTVGLPISTFLIDAKGGQWITKNECCYEEPGDPMKANQSKRKMQ
jgi:hypothetical protein